MDVEIYGYDFDKTSQLAEQTRRLCMALPGARDVNISREDDRPDIKITVDKEKASRLGLSSATISTYLRNRVAGMNCGYLKDDGSEYDIVVRLQEEDRNSISDIMDLTIPTPAGAKVKLSEVAEVGEYWAPPTIERKSRQRIVTVKVTPYNTSLGELAEQIKEKVIPELDIPAGYSTRPAQNNTSPASYPTCRCTSDSMACTLKSRLFISMLLIFPHPLPCKGLPASPSSPERWLLFFFLINPVTHSYGRVLEKNLVYVSAMVSVN